LKVWSIFSEAFFFQHCLSCRETAPEDKPCNCQNKIRKNNRKVKMAVFWVVAPCSLVELYQRFRGPCCLHHQGDACFVHVIRLAESESNKLFGSFSNSQERNCFCAHQFRPIQDRVWFNARGQTWRRMSMTRSRLETGTNAFKKEKKPCLYTNISLRFGLTPICYT
jgi:hypothetical protein